MKFAIHRYAVAAPAGLLAVLAGCTGTSDSATTTDSGSPTIPGESPIFEEGMIFGDGTAPLDVAEQTELLQLCEENNDIGIDCKIILRGTIEESAHCDDPYGFVEASVVDLLGLIPENRPTMPEDPTLIDALGLGPRPDIRTPHGCPTYGPIGHLTNPPSTQDHES